MKACSKGTTAAACLGYALITAALFWASPYIRPEPSTGVFLAVFSAASLWACKRLPVRGWLRGARAGRPCGGGAVCVVCLLRVSALPLR